MSLIYSISDTHLSNRQGFSRDITSSEFPGTNNRFQEIIKAIRTCASQAIDDDAEALVIPGDVFQTRGILPVAVYNASYRVFEEISKKIRLIFIPGNHDMVSSTALHGDEGLHSLYGFKEFASVAHKPEMYVTDSFTISMIPFIHSKEATIEAAKALRKRSKRESKRFDLVFFHHSFEGCETGPINWKMPYPLQYEDIPDFDGKYSGHIHKHQKIGEGLIYIGAPVHHDAGERHYKPGWLCIDANGGYKHIENRVSPRFVVMEAATEKEIKNLAEDDYKIIKWTGDPAEGYKLRDSYDNMRVEVAPKESNNSIRTEIKTSDSVENMMRKYMAAKNGSVDEELLTYGIDVWRSNEVL